MMNIAIIRSTKLTHVITPLKRYPVSGGFGQSITPSKSWVVGWPQLRGLATAANNTKASFQSQTVGDKGDESQDAERLHRLRKHLKLFFAQYPKFKYDPTKPYMGEFQRMKEQFKWSDESKAFKEARRKLYDASVLQFNSNFDGKNKKKLKKWERLFSKINLLNPSPTPTTVAEFKKRVESVHANICDVLDSDVTKVKAKDFGSEVSLSRYTIRTDKKFPRKHILAGDILRHLLRHIDNPSETRGLEVKIAKTGK